MTKVKLSNKDKIYQWIANHVPIRLVWFCAFRAWALYRKMTNYKELPSEVLMYNVMTEIERIS